MRELLTLAAQNSLGAAMLALLAIVAALLLRRPALTHILWVLVLVKLITPPIWTIPVKIGREEPVMVSTVDAPRTEAVQSRPLLSDLPVDSVESAPLQVVAPIAKAQKPRRVNWELASIGAASLWICGSIVFTTIALVRLRRFSKLLCFAVDVPPDVRRRADDLAQRLALRGAPRVAFIPAPISPMLLGFPIPARLLIPRRLWDQLTDSQRDALLLHELAHYRRRDHWVRGLELIVTLIHWWNPLTWLARRQLRIAEELCCDAWVTWALPQHADDYAAALVDAIDFAASRPALPLLASGVGDFKHLQRRLLMIRSRQGNRKMGWTGLVACAAIVVLPLTLTRAKQTPLAGGSTRSTPPAATPSDPTNDLETHVVFRGIAYEDEKPIVFLEDLRDASTMKLHRGDTVTATGGKIVNVTLNADKQFLLDYARRNGDLVRVKLGLALADGTAGNAPPAATQPDPDAALLKALDRELPEITFQGTGLGDVVSFFNDVTGTKIVADWASLAEAGVDRSAPTRIQIRHAPFRQMLRMTLRSIIGQKSPIGALVDHGVVIIAPVNRLRQMPGFVEAKLIYGPSAPDRTALQQLDLVIPEIDFDRVGLADTIDFMRDVTEANIFVDWDKLEAAHIDQNANVSLKIKNEKFGRVLDLLLIAAAGSGKLQYSVDGKVIVISVAAAPETRPATRSAVELKDSIRRLSDAGKYSEALDAVNQVLSLDPKDDLANAMRPLLQDRVNRTSQQRPSGRPLQAADSPKAGDADRKAAEQLDRTLPDLRFNGVALGDVVDFLRDVVGIQLSVNWKTLEVIGVTHNTPVTLSVRNIKLRKGLDLLLANADPKQRLAYMIEGGVLQITTKLEVHARIAQVFEQFREHMNVPWRPPGTSTSE